MQEVITLSVFAPFAVLYMNEPLKWNYLWAGECLLGAVHFYVSVVIRGLFFFRGPYLRSKNE